MDREESAAEPFRRPCGAAAVGRRVMHLALGTCGDFDAANVNVGFNGGRTAMFCASRDWRRGYAASMRIVGDKGRSKSAHLLRACP